MSIGAAQAFADGGAAGALLAAADAAMYEAKRGGRAALRFHDASMGQARHAQARLCRELPRAIANGELVPFYQPIVDLRTGLVRGLEALVRWNHPERGLLGPAAFPAAFEEPGLAVAIDDFVFETALADMGRWAGQGLPVAAVNVNASDAQLHREGLVARIEALLRRNRLGADRLKVEVVETAFLGRDPERVADTIGALAELGVVCALDDFGTGYASLSHLRRFKVGRIKIDCSFVAGICADPFDRGLVKSLVDLGRNLGMRVTAEGVETPEQLEILRGMGCDCGQGYWIGRPAPTARVSETISRWYAKHASLGGDADSRRRGGT